MKVKCPCGVEFEAKRSTARYHSEACKKAAQRRSCALPPTPEKPRSVVRRAKKVVVVRTNLQDLDGRGEEEPSGVSPCTAEPVTIRSYGVVTAPNLQSSAVAGILSRLPSSRKEEPGKANFQKGRGA